MRRIALPMLVVLSAACQDYSEPTAPPSDAQLSAVPSLDRLSPAQVPESVMQGEVVVRVRAGVDANAVAVAHGAAVSGRGYAGAFVVMMGGAGNERALAARLRGDARVAYAEPNFLRQPTAIRSELWAFYNPGGRSITFTKGGSRGQVVASYISDLDADEDNVEGYAGGGAAVLVGSIDTGVDFAHSEFLPGQLIAGMDWYSNDANPADENDHGTHTTGTMVGRTVGVAGVSGAGANVRVYVQRVCGRRGCPSSAIASAIRAAADQPGMVAMNLSLGGGSLSVAEQEAIAYAVNTRGVLVIASAGNGGTGTVGCPACDPLALSVAATNWQDELSYYSSWGAGLDLSAPGGEVYSNTTQEAGIFSSVRGGGYAFFQGTSMAAPQVTGTAGIVASRTGLTGAALRARLVTSVDDLGAGGYDQTFGAGRLNSYRAVTGLSLPGGG
jgi:serine protease